MVRLAVINKETAIYKRGKVLPKVWIFQPRVEHYRVPVFDGIQDVAHDKFQLTVLGTLDHGRAFGGGTREYFQHLELSSVPFAGNQLFYWRRGLELVEKEQPDVLVVSPDLRNLTSWRLPRARNKMGLVTIAWGKVHSYSGLPILLLNNLKRYLYRKYDLYLCYGEQSKSELIDLNYPQNRIWVARNTIDTQKIFHNPGHIIKRAERLSEQYGVVGKKILLCLGRMDREKRQEDLLFAWPQLRVLHPDLFLVLVGRGPRYEKISQNAKRLDPDRIVVTEHAPEGDDYAWISMCDAFIVPGAVGLAINISLAFGRPTVIADEYGADGEIVQEGITGWRFPKGDINCMVKTITEVLQGGEEVDRRRTNGQQLMSHQVTIQNMVSVMVEACLKGIEMGRLRRKA